MIAGFLNHQQYLKHLKHFPLSPSPPLFAGDRSVLPHSSCHTKTIHSMPPTWKTHRAPGPGGLSIIRWVAVLGPQNSSKRFQRIHPNTLHIYIYNYVIYIYSNLPHATNVWQTLEILENCSFSSRCVAVLHCISGISEDGKTRETMNQNPAKVSEMVNNKYVDPNLHVSIMTQPRIPTIHRNKPPRFLEHPHWQFTGGRWTAFRHTTTWTLKMMGLGSQHLPSCFSLGISSCVRNNGCLGGQRI